jgi:hypothetical protein
MELVHIGPFQGEAFADPEPERYADQSHRPESPGQLSKEALKLFHGEATRLRLQFCRETNGFSDLT